MSNEKLKNVVLVVLAICLIGITVAYATLSQNLDISGVAKVGKTSWNIHFTKVLTPKTEGYAEGGKATLNSDSTVLTVSEGILKVPGDTITYVFDVINEGDLDAEVETVLTTIDSCKASDNTTDVTMYCDKIKYDLVYQDTKEEVKKKDQLLKGESKTLNLIITYDKNKELTSLPSTEIILDNITSTINYTMTQKSTPEIDKNPTDDSTKLPTYDVADTLYFDPVKYELCDEDSTSNTCYSWFVLSSNKPNNTYELVYKNLNYTSDTVSEGYNTDLVTFINYITDSWSNKIPKVDSSYNVSGVIDFTSSKARIMTYNELNNNDQELYNKIKSNLTTSNPTYLIGDENSFAGANKSALVPSTNMPPYAYFPNVSMFPVNPVIKIELSNVDNAKDYGSSDEDVLVCDEHIYDNGTITKEQYNKACKTNITTTGDVYSYSENSDGTISLTGFKGDVPSIYNNVLALPTTIDGKTVTQISGNLNRALSSKLVISPTIITIGEEAFKGNSFVALAIPNSVTSIGNYSFQQNNLSSLKIPSSVEVIGTSAFDSNNISDLTINEGLKTLYSQAFGNNALTSAKLPDSLTSIDPGVFYGTQVEILDIGGGIPIKQGKFDSLKNTLKELTIGSDNITTTQEQDQGAFSNYSKLQKVTVKSNVKKIGTSLFSSDVSLNSVKLPSTITEIGDYAFQGTSNLKDIKLSSSLESIGEKAFNESKLSSIAIPDSTISIGESAFKDVPLTSISLGNGLQKIYATAFSGSSSIDTLDIPDSVTFIGRGAFYNKKINTLTIGDGIRSIDSGMFISVTAKTVNIGKDSSKSQTIGSYALNSSVLNGTETINIYGSVKNIEEQSFSYLGITSLNLNDGITKIGDGAFMSNNLTSINIPKTLTTIGSSVFQGNLSLKTVNDYSENVTCSNLGSNSILYNKVSNTSTTCSAN